MERRYLEEIPKEELIEYLESYGYTVVCPKPPPPFDPPDTYYDRMPITASKDEEDICNCGRPNCRVYARWF